VSSGISDVLDQAAETVDSIVETGVIASEIWNARDEIYGEEPTEPIVIKEGSFATNSTIVPSDD
jgi:hypothetical protein